MVKLLLRVVLSSGVVSSAVLVKLDSVDNTIARQNKTKNEKIEKSIETITTIDDIDLYGKAHGCTFVFVKGGKSKEVYKVKKFLKKETSENSPRGSGSQNAIGGIDGKAKNKCKNNKGVIALFNNSSTGFGADDNFPSDT